MCYFIFLLFLLNFEFVTFFFIAGPVLAGPTISLDSYEVDCKGHGPCERCDERCIGHGFKHGGGCYGFAQCCCVIN